MNIEDIIKQRLELQSTQRALWNDFQVSHDLNIIKSNSFLCRYKTWDEKRKKDFIITLGGRANFKKTKELLEK